MGYSPHTPSEISEMLNDIGVSSIEELFSDIPSAFLNTNFNIPESKSEFKVTSKIKNKIKTSPKDLINFSGGGVYDHFIPSVVNSISRRPEFLTPYTPYQPECAQGTLQAIYEYQTAICRLTEMDSSNASLYDGGTALAEAALMALKLTRKRRKIIIDSCVNFHYRNILKTYLSNIDCEIIEIAPENYGIDIDSFESSIDENTCAVILQNPNFFGRIYDYTDIIEKAHSNGALAILSVYPISLGMLKTPGEMDADITTGEGQSMGMELNFGGPYLGFMAVKRKFARKLPGRIAGKTVDNHGKPGFVLTMQAREQHIRRQKATSNICTNQNHCAIRALLYLISVGKKGLREISKQNYHKANYAKNLLSDINGVRTPSHTTYNEFVIEFNNPAEDIYSKMLEKGFNAGILLGRIYPGMENNMLICVTEKLSRETIDKFVQELKGIINNQ
ncbi:MAG: aminomethyl-transferring glycine dehydrogenase subunit GcvPA [Elusimicrobiota bacterium]